MPQIKTTVNDRTIAGIVKRISESDLSVEIICPYKDISNSTHIPYFAIHNKSFLKKGNLTNYAFETGSRLLKEIYFTCVGIENNEMKIRTLLGPEFSSRKEINFFKKYDKITELIGVQSSVDTLKQALEKLLLTSSD